MLEVLIANGADVNAKDNNNLTPSIMAHKRRHTEVVEILAKAAEEQKTTEDEPSS